MYNVLRNQGLNIMIKFKVFKTMKELNVFHKYGMSIKVINIYLCPETLSFHLFYKLK